MGNLTKHFDREEFFCKCCGKEKMDPRFVAQIEEARELADLPFVITSGYRCPRHNLEVGSKSENHTTGRAADIICADGPRRLKIIMALLAAGFFRIGIATTFIHTDIMDSTSGAQPSIWLY